MEKNNGTLDLESIGKNKDSKTTIAYLSEQRGKNKTRRAKEKIVKRAKRPSR